MITIEPMSGLTNRMRAIDSAAALAADLGMPLEVIWNRDRSAGCRFRDLFEVTEPISALREVDRLTPTGKARTLFERSIGLRRRPDFGKKEIRELTRARFDFRELRTMPSVHISTCDDFYRPGRPFMTFTPVRRLGDVIQATVAGFEATVGVHVRRGDNRRSIESSPLELFVARMRREVEGNAATTFFLATDSSEVEAELRGLFPGRILTYPKRALDRRRREAIEDAVIDLFCLARTSRLFASYHSSFSETASRLRDTPYEVIRNGHADRFWW